MYIALTWLSMTGINSAEVRDDILEKVAEFKIVNQLEVFDNHLIANIMYGRGLGSGVAFDLEEQLRQMASQRFSFTLHYLPKGQPVLHSDDIDNDELERRSDF